MMRSLFWSGSVANAAEKLATALQRQDGLPGRSTHFLVFISCISSFSRNVVFPDYLESI